MARTIVLNSLNQAARTRSQLEELLARRGCDPEVARAVLDRLTEVGLIDDAAFARDLVSSRHANRGLARRALALDLSRRGIDDETAQEALEQITPEAEAGRARDLARDRVRRLHGLPRDVQVRRLAGYLARKGYGGDVAFAVVREVVGELPEHRRD